MDKQEFLTQLGKELSCLPQDDVEERLNFYSEMIDDRMEEGRSEEDAVSAVGSVEDIAGQIIADTPLATLAKERIKPKRRLTVWEIVLLVLGSPVWFSLLVAAFAVVLSLYVVLWAVIISLWAVFVSVAGCALGGVAAGLGFVFSGYSTTGIAMIGAGIVCAGLSILLFFVCKGATKGALQLTKTTARGIKNCFLKRRERNE